ncbi:metallo-beta-lactamase superfamily protein [Thelonectria olida]|uniref:Metallo-beta-lactamase superfamily protein n=1 Tax=Thelonectria olida TaxID=1576542 RepID=A0A9P9AM01_9HYPO|nr:metallo-beta-lactamase superfamily protein [Thelonectria olida]
MANDTNPALPGADQLRLQFISTGTVQVRSAMMHQPATNSVLMRRWRSFTDRTWSESLPIGVFLISHPDGPILFDTGESPACNDPGYMSAWNPTKWMTVMDIRQEEGIVEQLRALGTEPATLQAIVLSHLHSDHVGGLKALLAAAPDVPVFVTKEHWDDVGKHQTLAAIKGYAPANWPPNFAPRELVFENESLGPWKDFSRITPDGSVVAVKTPGHVLGHVSLIVFAGADKEYGTTYLLPGDATYGVDLLDVEEPDGINDDPMTALQSLQLMKEFARQRPVVVLPSHDPKTPVLLRDRVVYEPKEGPKI